MRTWFACVGLLVALFLAVPAVASGQVDINQASAEELQSLNGVGEVLAGRIIDFREANDGFDSVDQLEEVKGIGSQTLSELEDRVVAGD